MTRDAGGPRGSSRRDAPKASRRRAITSCR
ncbi:hypothetical protein [Methylobacterium aerolatum]